MRGQRQRGRDHPARRAAAASAVARAYANASSDTLESSTSISYERASCEYQISSGLHAVSAAAIRPARREINFDPAP